MPGDMSRSIHLSQADIRFYVQGPAANRTFIAAEGRVEPGSSMQGLPGAFPIWHRIFHFMAGGETEGGNFITEALSMRDFRSPFFTTAFLGLVLLAALSAVPASAGKEERYNASVLIEHSIAMRQAHQAWRAEVRSAEMNASGDFVHSLDGADASSLDQISARFNVTRANITAAKSPAELSQVHRDLQELSKKYRVELRSQVLPAGGNVSELRGLIHEAVRSSPRVSLLEDAYWNVRQSGELFTLDYWIERAENTANHLESQGYNVTSLLETLDQLKDMQDELRAALEQRDQEALQEVQREVMNLTHELLCCTIPK